MTLLPGATLGPYRIVEQIGRGGMATVYKAYQPSLARNVAIKVLPAFFAEEAGFRERFQQEAIAIAKLRHPNILQVFDYGEEGGVTYIVSEFVDGGTLAEQVGQPLPVDYVVKMLAPIAAALDYAHARGVLHRDIKPSNILLARDATPILSDFGLAKMAGSMPRLTRTGMAVGTPEYMAPEQGAGEEVGPAADRYALAVVAYELLTGRVPFTAETPVAVLLAHMHKPLPLPRAVNPALPPAVEEVLLKGLAKVPGDRHPTAVEFVSALAGGAGGGAARPVAVTAAPTPAPPRAAPRRPPLRIVAPVAALVLLLAAGVAIALLREEAGEDEEQAAPATPISLPAVTAAPAASPAEPPATPQAATTPAGVSRGEAPKGQLLYEAKLDSSGSAIGQRTAFPDRSAGEVRALDGAIELAVLKAGGSVGFGLRRNYPPAAYFAEIEVKASAGSDLTLTWLLSSSPSGSLQVRVDAEQETAVLEFLPAGPGPVFAEQISGTVDLPQYRSGRRVTLGVGIGRDRYSLWVDDRRATQGSDERVGSQAQPIFFSAFGRNPGTLTFSAIRLYAVAR